MSWGSAIKGLADLVTEGIKTWANPESKAKLKRQKAERDAKKWKEDKRAKLKALRDELSRLDLRRQSLEEQAEELAASKPTTSETKKQ